MSIWDILLTVVVVAFAVWYLYRKIIVTKGCSCGCSSCPSSGCDTLQKKDKKKR